jgi:hypothetical protein
LGLYGGPTGAVQLKQFAESQDADAGQWHKPIVDPTSCLAALQLSQPCGHCGSVCC